MRVDDFAVEMPDLGEISVPLSFDDIQIPDGLILKRSLVKKEIRERELGTFKRRCVKAEYAREIVDMVPESDAENVHAVLKGNFILGDTIPHLIDKFGAIREGWLVSLNMGEVNARMLAELVESGRVGKLSVLLGHYFASVNKADIWLTVKSLLLGCGVRLGIERVHAKVIALQFESGLPLVIEGSANLRACGSIEQVTLFRSLDLLEFHASWIKEVIEASPHDVT